MYLKYISVKDEKHGSVLEIVFVPLIDGVFSIVTASLNQEHSLETPRDVERTPAEYQTHCLVLHFENTRYHNLDSSISKTHETTFQDPDSTHAASVREEGPPV